MFVSSQTFLYNHLHPSICFEVQLNILCIAIGYGFISLDYGRDGDPTDSLSRYQARLEARCYDNMEEARFLWDDIMTRHRKQAEYWLEYAQLER